jgi:cell division protease FtsH
MLDPALLRAGRFDRHVAVPRPDLKGREEILEVHVRDIRLSDDVDLHKVAGITPGFVGADLANLANEAALLAARRNKTEVEQEDFEDSVERVVAGLEKRNRVMNEEEKKIVAHHECGHALVACLVPGADTVKKVSMIPRGVGGLGYTMQMPEEDRYLLRKRELIDRLSSMLGGRAAEEIIFGEISTGAQDDLQKATNLAQQMVSSYGMSDEFGPLSFPSDENPRNRYQGNDGSGGSGWSQDTRREVDNAVRKIVNTAYSRGKELLSDNQEVLEHLASALMEREVLEQQELRDILEEHGIELGPSKHFDSSKGEQEEAEEAEATATSNPDSEESDSAEEASTAE